jgi:hypothetical protein
MATRFRRCQGCAFLHIVRNFGISAQQAWQRVGGCRSVLRVPQLAAGNVGNSPDVAARPAESSLAERLTSVARCAVRGRVPGSAGESCVVDLLAQQLPVRAGRCCGLAGA